MTILIGTYADGSKRRLVPMDEAILNALDNGPKTSPALLVACYACSPFVMKRDVERTCDALNKSGRIKKMRGNKWAKP